MFDQIVVKSLICEFLDTLATVPTRCAVIATSNRLAQVDRCFRRAGRLDKEIDVLESSEDDRYRYVGEGVGQRMSKWVLD